MPRSLFAGLVLADISGYSQFVLNSQVSLLHAEELITELLESVTKAARHPLKLNKLIGDAALFYAEASPSEGAVDDIARQAVAFITAFRSKQAELFRRSMGGCGCVACCNVERLRLKVFLHVCDIVEKTVSGSTEIAGAGVILINRLTKNAVAAKEYLMIPAVTAAALTFAPFPRREMRTEEVPDLGPTEVVVFYPEAYGLDRPDIAPFSRTAGTIEAVRLTWTAKARRALRALRGGS